jgi:hypothetical protein
MPWVIEADRRQGTRLIPEWIARPFKQQVWVKQQDRAVWAAGLSTAPLCTGLVAVSLIVRSAARAPCSGGRARMTSVSHLDKAPPVVGRRTFLMCTR